jgi:outer membrane protein TolC
MIALGILMVGVADAVLVEARGARPEAEAPVPPATELAALRQQRINTLRTAADTARQMYDQGALDFAEMLRINRALLEAEVESAVTINERVALLTKALAAAKQQEDVVSKRYQAGTATRLATLEATAERLYVEARLAALAEK